MTYLDRTITVTMNTELHRAVKIAAIDAEMTVSEWCRYAFEDRLMKDAEMVP